VTCPACDREIDGAGPAVGVYGKPEQAMYIEFVEDLRASGFELIHPVCFAASRGIERLVGVVHERDLKDRGWPWKMGRLEREVQELRQQLSQRR
jgi:hypothetical protein